MMTVDWGGGGGWSWEKILSVCLASLTPKNWNVVRQIFLSFKFLSFSVSSQHQKETSQKVIMNLLEAAGKLYFTFAHDASSYANKLTRFLGSKISIALKLGKTHLTIQQNDHRTNGFRLNMNEIQVLVKNVDKFGSLSTSEEKGPENDIKVKIPLYETGNFSRSFSVSFIFYTYLGHMSFPLFIRLKMSL